MDAKFKVGDVVQPIGYNLQSIWSPSTVDKVIGGLVHVMSVKKPQTKGVFRSEDLGSVDAQGLLRPLFVPTSPIQYDGNGYAPGEIVAYKNKCTCELYGPNGLLAVGCQCKGC